MSTKYPMITLTNSENGATVTGELVLESSTAYQLAVGGKVRSYYKTEWGRGVSLGSIFGGSL